MRVLVLSALLACAAAAPSGALLPLAPAIAAPFIGPVALPAFLPTIPPGDIQAAAINAKVAAEDKARALNDQAREFAEQDLEKTAEVIGESTDDVKEKAEEVFWAGEEKKWQALDAVNTAQATLQGNIANIEGSYANIEGAVAKNAEILAKSALTGPVVIPSPILPFGFVAPTPLFNTPIVASKSSILEPTPIEPIRIENTIKLPVETPAIITKSAEIEPIKEEKPLKSTDEKPQLLPSALPLTAQIIPAPLALTPGLKFQPWISPIAYSYIQPGLKTLDTSALAYSTPYLPGVYSLFRAW